MKTFWSGQNLHGEVYRMGIFSSKCIISIILGTVGVKGERECMSVSNSVNYLDSRVDHFQIAAYAS